MSSSRGRAPVGGCPSRRRPKPSLASLRAVARSPECVASAGTCRIGSRPTIRRGMLAAMTNKGIVVSGTGKAAQVPDLLVLDAGVEVRCDTAQEAYAEARDALHRVRDAALTAGVAQEDLATTEVSLRPSHNRIGEPNGHEAALGVAIKVRGMEAGGAVITAVTQAGGAHARLAGVRLEHSDPASLQRRARAAAVQGAHAKAEELARLVGRSLGECLAVSEGADPGARPMMMRAGMAVSSDLPIDPGAVEVVVQVIATWALAD